MQKKASLEKVILNPEENGINKKFKTDLFATGSCHKVDGILFLLHALQVLCQAGHVFVWVGWVETQQLGKTSSVGVILHHTQLDAVDKRIV